MQCSYSISDASLATPLILLIYLVRFKRGSTSKKAPKSQAIPPPELLSETGSEGDVSSSINVFHVTVKPCDELGSSSNTDTLCIDTKLVLLIVTSLLEHCSARNTNNRRFSTVNQGCNFIKCNLACCSNLSKHCKTTILGI